MSPSLSLFSGSVPVSHGIDKYAGSRLHTVAETVAIRIGFLGIRSSKKLVDVDHSIGIRIILSIVYQSAEAVFVFVGVGHAVTVRVRKSFHHNTIDLPVGQHGAAGAFVPGTEESNLKIASTRNAVNIGRAGEKIAVGVAGRVAIEAITAVEDMVTDQTRKGVAIGGEVGARNSAKRAAVDGHLKRGPVPLRLDAVAVLKAHGHSAVHRHGDRGTGQGVARGSTVIAQNRPGAARVVVDERNWRIALGNFGESAGTGIEVFVQEFDSFAVSDQPCTHHGDGRGQQGFGKWLVS